MSKKSIETRNKIIFKAIEMFNERGVEYVGLRELAAVLDMRVSNITYYFPTKDDLVDQLSLDMNKLTEAVLVIDKNITITSFLEMIQRASHIQLRYSGLLLSMVHLLSRNKVMLARHKKTQEDRNAISKANINSLIKSGYLRIDDEHSKEYLICTIGLIARFWISEAAISFRRMNADEQSRLYLSMISNLLSPYATAKGRKQIKDFWGTQK